MIQGVSFAEEGNSLVITISPEGQAELQQEKTDNPDFESDSFMWDVLESVWTNGYSIVPEGAVALMSAPALTDGDVDGLDLSPGAKVFAFMDYQVRSPQDDLLENGKCVFQGAPENARQGSRRMGGKYTGNVDADFETTGLMPSVVADTVGEDVAAEVGKPESASEYSAYLTEHFAQIYQNNQDWASKIIADTVDSRDTLYSFMYHWAAAYAIERGDMDHQKAMEFQRAKGVMSASLKRKADEVDTDLDSYASHVQSCMQCQQADARMVGAGDSPESLYEKAAFCPNGLAMRQNVDAYTKSVRSADVNNKGTAGPGETYDGNGVVIKVGDPVIVSFNWDPNNGGDTIDGTVVSVPDGEHVEVKTEDGQTKTVALNDVFLKEEMNFTIVEPFTGTKVSGGKKVKADKPFEATGIGDTTIQTWFERDRAHVALVDAATEQTTIIEWWDESVNEAVEDGFLDPSDYHQSAYDYAKDNGFLVEVAPKDEDEEEEAETTAMTRAQRRALRRKPVVAMKRKAAGVTQVMYNGEVRNVNEQGFIDGDPELRFVLDAKDFGYEEPEYLENLGTVYYQGRPEGVAMVFHPGEPAKFSIDPEGNVSPLMAMKKAAYGDDWAATDANGEQLQEGDVVRSKDANEADETAQKDWTIIGYSYPQLKVKDAEGNVGYVMPSASVKVGMRLADRVLVRDLKLTGRIAWVGEGMVKVEHRLGEGFYLASDPNIALVAQKAMNPREKAIVLADSIKWLSSLVPLTADDKQAIQARVSALKAEIRQAMAANALNNPDFFRTALEGVEPTMGGMPEAVEMAIGDGAGVVQADEANPTGEVQKEKPGDNTGGGFQSQGPFVSPNDPSGGTN